VHNFHRALYAPAVGFYLLVAHIVFRLGARLPKRSAPILAALGISLLAVVTGMNIHLSRKDIAQYDARSARLEAIADHAQAFDPPPPPGSFIIMLDAPDESWIIEDIYQLFCDDGILRLTGLEFDAIDPLSLSMVGDNAWTRDQAIEHIGSVPDVLILLEFRDGHVMERQRILFEK
jgi:hypothetical protein